MRRFLSSLLSFFTSMVVFFTTTGVMVVDLLAQNQSGRSIVTSSFEQAIKMPDKGIYTLLPGELVFLDNKWNVTLRMSAKFKFPLPQARLEKLKEYKDYEDNKVTGYISVPIASVFDRPGVTWKDNLRFKQQYSVAWPTMDSRVVISDSTFALVKDPKNENVKFWALYYAIKLRNNKGAQVSGWIVSDFVRIKSAKDESMMDSMGSDYSAKVQWIAKAMSQHVAKEIKTIKLNRNRNRAIFSYFHQAYLRYEKLENGTPNEYIAMDSLARTIFAEMEGCYKYGRQYLQAVAAVVYNRVRSGNFEVSGPDPIHPVTMIVGEANQFSVWNRKLNNGRLAVTLNPLGNSKDNERDLKEKILMEALLIAVEVVTEPETFERRLNGAMKQALYMTSRISRPYPPVVGGKIDGKDLRIKECIRLWKEPKERLEIASSG